MPTPKQRAQRRKRHMGTIILMVLDVLMFIAVLKLAQALRLWVYPRFYKGFPEGEVFLNVENYWWFIAIWFFFFLYEKLYTEAMPYWDEVLKAAFASLLAMTGVMVVVSIGKLSDVVSRTVILSMGAMLITVYPFIRLQFKVLLRNTGLLRRRVIILGAGKTGRLILSTMRKEPNMGYEVLGFLDDDPSLYGEVIDGVKVHGPLSRAEYFICHASISDVVIAIPGASGQFHEALINRLQHRAEHILFVPDLFGMAVLGITVQHFFSDQAFALQMKNNLAQPLNSLLKLVFDYILSAILLLVTALPMVIISLAIKLTSAGPVFFHQQRMGRKCKPFYCLKFRTMYRDAEERLQHILDSDPVARRQWQDKHKLSSDPRITPMGRFLRKTSLDELPQLLNILKGEMSLIGPRPVTSVEIKCHYKDMAEHCFRVKPGITGLWQVSGRSNTSYKYRVTLDTWYVRNWNLWLDIIILMKTVKVVFRAEGAQ